MVDRGEELGAPDAVPSERSLRGKLSASVVKNKPHVPQTDAIFEDRINR